MGAKRTRRTSLAEEVLAVYSRAVQDRELAAAEHLLEALEALAEGSPDCEDCRDQAYMALTRLSGSVDS